MQPLLASRTSLPPSHLHAPPSPPRLKDILELFVDQLDCLGSSSPETERRFHLLEVLRSMQVFALAGEVDKPGFAIEAFVFRALQRFLRIAE